MAKNEKNEFEVSPDNNVEGVLNNEATDIINENTEEAETLETQENIGDIEDNSLNIDNKEKLEDVSDNKDDESNSYSSQFGELEDFVDDYSSEDFDGKVAESTLPKQKKKIKKSTLITTIVIAVVVVAALAVGAYFVFFNNTIKGVWVMEDSDMKIFYTFTDDELVMSVDTEYMSESMSYQLSYKDEGTYCYMSAGNISQTYNYEISGNLIFGKTLTISSADYQEAEPLVLTYAFAKDNVEMKGPDFTKNDSIIGYWKFSNPMYGYDSYMEFTDDGTVYNRAVTPLYTDILSFKYNYDGKQITTLSSGGTNSSGETVEAGSESKMDAVVKDGKLTITSNGYDTVYEKSSKEDFEKYKASVLDGTYEAPTMSMEDIMNASTEPATNSESATGATESNTVPTETSTKAD